MSGEKKELDDVMSLLSSTASGYQPAKEDVKVKQRSAQEKEKVAMSISNKLKAASQSTVETCFKCGKQVYLAERKEVRVSGKKEVFHRDCFRCNDCNVVLDLAKYESAGGHIYCQTHFKDHLELNKWGQVVNTGASFVPVESGTKHSEKQETSEAVAASVRKFREGADANKCPVCTKTVYLAEKIDVEIKGEKNTFHKFCFKCSVCGMVLNFRNFDSMNGVLYCKSHLPVVQQIKSDNAFFVSPLKHDQEAHLQKLQFEHQEQPVDDQPSHDNESRSEDSQSRHAPQPVSEPPKEEKAKADHTPVSSLASSTTDSEESREEERRKRREERERRRLEDEKQEEEERKRREKEREERRKKLLDGDSSSSTSSTSEPVDDDERRRRDREERRKQREEAAKKELEEADRKAEERRKRLDQLKQNK